MFPSAQSGRKRSKNSGKDGVSYIVEEYEITPNNALSYKKEEVDDFQEIKKDVTRIKEEIRRLGSVNVNAIEDTKNFSNVTLS